MNTAVLSFYVTFEEAQAFRWIGCYAIDMVTKIQIWRDINAEISGIVNRFKDLGVDCVISMDGFSRPRYVQDLTLGRIEIHVPQLFPLLEFIQVILKGGWVILSLNCQVHRGIIRKETNLGMDMVGQVIYVKQK